jgi:hypothetical protein
MLDVDFDVGTARVSTISRWIAQMQPASISVPPELRIVEGPIKLIKVKRRKGTLPRGVHDLRRIGLSVLKALMIP